MLVHKLLNICVHAFIRIQGEHVQHRLKHQTGQCYTAVAMQTENPFFLPPGTDPMMVTNALNVTESLCRLISECSLKLERLVALRPILVCSR